MELVQLETSNCHFVTESVVLVAGRRDSDAQLRLLQVVPASGTAFDNHTGSEGWIRKHYSDRCELNGTPRS
jgi:hypothetical protein